jgi:MFS family permease
MSDKFPVAALASWLLVAIYYFYQYALRSAPSVMIPQLAEAFGASALGVASIVGMFYYGYSPFSLVAGSAIDRFGPRKVIPIGAALVGVGAFLFGTGNVAAANLGRFLQGAGGVFALVGAVYLATKNFPSAYAASLIGATQMFGMGGGSAGQFLVGPLIKHGLSWGRFWIYAGGTGLVLSLTLFILLPKDESRRPNIASGSPWADLAGSLKRVFVNPQSILCGLISGLLFIPTTIFAMTWGVRYLQEARGREYEYAVSVAATVPLGWMLGCPALGFISDRIGRRKPVIFAGEVALLLVLGWVLFGIPGFFRGPVIGILAGIASGAAMIPYTIIKEVNPPELGGSATGVINFINFTFSALLGPIFGARLARLSEGQGSMTLEDYQSGFASMLYGIGLAIVLTWFLRETGPAEQSDLKLNVPASKALSQR